MSDIGTIMRTSAVIPVLVIDDAADARPLAAALVAGGLKVLKVTLRTPAALDAIPEMKRVPAGAIVGAGTVVNAGQFGEAVNAGAEFIVSPGLTERLAGPIVESGVPYLPGVANAADIMLGMDLGLSHVKFFPAEASGGLKALAAPFYEARFCPTGGIGEASAPEWLAFEPVLCVGGSWVTLKDASPVEVETLARLARLPVPPVACQGCGGLFEPREGPTHPYMLSSPGCWAAYGEVLAREYTDPALFAMCHRLTVDAYAVQHPGSPTERRAVQSVWLHFAALDALFSHGASHDAARVLMQRLAGRDAFPALPDRPPMPLTVLDVVAGDHGGSAERWARSAHAAWAPLLKPVTDGWQ